MGTPRHAASATWNPQCEEILKGVGQTEGMVTPRCAASATWNPHVDVKGLEDAAGSGPWQCRPGSKRDEVGDKRNGPHVVVTRGGSGTWHQYRAQARDEVGGRAEHMVTPRRAASALRIPNVRRGQG